MFTLPSILVPVTILVLFFRPRLARLYGTKSREAGNEAILTYSPTQLNGLDIAAIVIHLLLKYLPIYGPPRLLQQGDEFPIPKIRLSGPLRITERDVTAFRQAVEIADSRTPQEKINPFFLVSLTTPLAILMLTHPESPIKPLGAVNTRNQFDFHNAGFCGSVQRLLDASEKGQLLFQAEMGGTASPGRRRKRQVTFTPHSFFNPCTQWNYHITVLY